MSFDIEDEVRMDREQDAQRDVWFDRQHAGDLPQPTPGEERERDARARRELAVVLAAHDAQRDTADLNGALAWLATSDGEVSS